MTDRTTVIEDFLPVKEVPRDFSCHQATRLDRHLGVLQSGWARRPPAAFRVVDA